MTETRETRDETRDDTRDDATEVTEAITQPRLGAVGWLRWMWRQLTSMRTALLLLFLLAIAAVPGSLLPQRPVNPLRVQQYIRDALPIFEIELTLDLGSASPTSARALVSGQSLSVGRQPDGRVRVEVPRLDDFEVIVLGS